ncbi:MAG: phosphatidate cytidylyltransferase [Bacteroidota bacterium]
MAQKKTPTYSNLTHRVLAALVGIPLMLVAICCSVWGYFLLFLAIMVLGMLEFYKLSRLQNVYPNQVGGIACGVVLYTLVFLRLQMGIAEAYLYVLIPMIGYIYLERLYQYPPEAFPFISIACTWLGVVYISLPLTLLHLLAFPHNRYSYPLVLGLLLILWAQDTGAYLVGSYMGKRALFKRVSPKKSWEGSAGGAILSLFVAYLLTRYLPIMPPGQWMGIAGVTVVFANYGDLVMSLFKRSVQVKDTGYIILGHGGILDRFDGFFFVIPSVLCFLKIWASLQSL